MSEIDPWEKAADCERAIQAAADPQQKTILKNLRYLWIALANESECMSADEFAHESETIGRLHVALARAAPLAPLESRVRHHRSRRAASGLNQSIPYSAAFPQRPPSGRTRSRVSAPKSAIKQPTALRRGFLCCTLATCYAARESGNDRAQ
jgi:hypothetical protein